MSDHEQKLQLALAKLIPEVISISEESVTFPYRRFFWTDHVPRSDQRVTQNEWLHICWLIEQGMTDEEWMNYKPVLQDAAGSITKDLMGFVNHNTKRTWSASWPQRAEAICKVKGVDA